MLSPIDLKYFLEVASALNVSRASARLGISQPSLSAAIQRLEKAVGTTLFNRHKKGVTLTPAGKHVLLTARQLLQYWEEIKTHALISHHDIQGVVTLGTHPSLALRSLSGFLPQLLAKYPKLEIKLNLDISRKITEQVINLAIDVGIVVNPTKHPDLIMQKLLDDEVSFWCSKKIKNTNQHIQSGKAVILCDTELAQTQWLLKRLQKKGIRYHRLINIRHLEIIADLTAQGCGVGILPGGVASSFVKQLTPIPKMPVYHDEIYLIYRPENRGIKAIQEINAAIKLFYASLASR